MPHWVIIVLALALSVPVCSNLASVRLSRVRLAAAVLFSQAVLHGLFALFPAASPQGIQAQDHSHHHGLEGTLTITPAGAAPPVHTESGISMAAAHLCAAVLTFFLLRRGEVLIQALIELLLLRPAILLVARTEVAPPASPRRQVQTSPVHPVGEIWPGEGPRTLRGPPAVVVH